jgi:hypothetical protein
MLADIFHLDQNLISEEHDVRRTRGSASTLSPHESLPKPYNADSLRKVLGHGVSSRKRGNDATEVAPTGKRLRTARQALLSFDDPTPLSVRYSALVDRPTADFHDTLRARLDDLDSMQRTSRTLPMSSDPRSGPLLVSEGDDEDSIPPQWLKQDCLPDSTNQPLVSPLLGYKRHLGSLFATPWAHHEQQPSSAYGTVYTPLPPHIQHTEMVRSASRESSVSQYSSRSGSPKQHFWCSDPDCGAVFTSRSELKYV